MSSSITETVLRRIQDSGGRVTVPTRLVVAILAQTDQHLTADDVIDELERRSPGIAPSTVYRVLQRLDELEMLEHVRSGAGAAFYHLRQHGHAHLMCTECGEVTDLMSDVDDALHRFGAAIRAAHGFSIDPQRAALLGRCRRCASERLAGPNGDLVTDLPTGDELTAAHRG
jgi:Fur family ferric uptake transcriptional regulator